MLLAGIFILWPSERCRIKAFRHDGREGVVYSEQIGIAHRRRAKLSFPTPSSLCHTRTKLCVAERITFPYIQEKFKASGAPEAPTCVILFWTSNFRRRR